MEKIVITKDAGGYVGLNLPLGDIMPDEDVFVVPKSQLYGLISEHNDIKSIVENHVDQCKRFVSRAEGKGAIGLA
jgi:hypothetical protein